MNTSLSKVARSPWIYSLVVLLFAACGGKSGEEDSSIEDGAGAPGQEDGADGTGGWVADGGGGFGTGGGPSDGGFDGSGGGGLPGVGGLPGPGVGGWWTGTGAAPGSGGFGGNVEDCQIQYGYEEGSYCDLQASCAGGTWAYVSCSPNGGGSSCYCDLYPFYASLSIDKPAKCREVLEFCKSDPFEDAEPTCELASASSSKDYCDASTDCRTEAEFPGGGTAVVSASQSSVACYPQTEGYLCECYNPSRVTMRLTSPTLPQGLCTNLVENVCDGDVEVTGAAECGISSQSAARDWCNIEYECSAPATIGGQSIELFQYSTASCSKDSGGLWVCNCDGTNTEPFASASGFTACSDVIGICGLSGG